MIAIFILFMSLIFCSIFWIVGFSIGLIPQTEPHFLKTVKAPWVKEIVEEFKNDNGSYTCEKVKELFGGRGRENEYQLILENYPDDVYTLKNGIKSKNKILNKYIGLNDEFTEEWFDGKLELCLDSD